jgi:hypothetical protein
MARTTLAATLGIASYSVDPLDGGAARQQKSFPRWEVEALGGEKDVCTPH